jgi:toxin ParE1/3/4
MPGSRHCSARRAPTMPRFELRYRPAALADLEDIFRAVLRVSASSVVTRRYVERIRDRWRRITLLPQGGRARDDLAPGLHSVPFERRAVIVYRVLGQTVEITNVFHGGRDYAALYRRGKPDEDG